MAARTALYSEDKASTGKNIEGSLLCVSGHSPELRRTTLNDGDRRCWTKSFWIKRGHVDRRMLFGCYQSGSNTACIEINSDGDIHWYDYVSAYRLRINPTGVIRDPAAWYHIVCVMDTHEITDSERARLYVNGVRITQFQNVTYPDLELEGIFNIGGIEHDWFTEGTNKRLHYDGFITDIHDIDGNALGPEYFGFTDPLTNTWKPKKYDYKVSHNITSTAYTIKSDEQSSDGQIATNAFDGDLEDAFAARWRNAGSSDGNIVNNAYIGQNFGNDNEKEIREIRLLQGRASSTGEMISQAKVQYSDNGSSWSDAGSAHTLETSSYGWQTLNVAAAGAHQYWRLLCTASSNSVWLVTEMKMYEYTLQPCYGPNGYHLPLDGSGPIGKDQSGQINPNNGTNWSSKHSGTIYGGAATDVFDGTDLTDKASVNSSDSAQNHFTLSSLSVTAKSIRVFVSNCSSNIEVSINGSVVGTISSSDIGDNARGTGFKFKFAETVVTSIKVRRVGSTSGWFIYGIQLDDVDLVDDKFANDWTPVNIQNSVAVDEEDDYNYGKEKATGALPILNTVCDGMSATVGVRTDLGAPGKLILALPLAGITTDVSPQLNGGTTAYPITVTGTGGYSKAHSNFYSQSLKFDGSGDRVRLNNANFVFGTKDFTIEAWAYKTNSDSEMIFSQIDNTASGRAGVILGYRSGQMWILQGDGSTWPLETDVGTFPLNQWVHVAVSRDYSETKSYYHINGELVYTHTSNITLAADNSGDMIIGNGGLTQETYNWTGYIQDFRVYDNYCKYSGEHFIPPSTQPAITLDSPTATIYPYEVETAIRGRECGSVSFDATDDDYHWSSTDFAYGSGTFTIECWFYVRQFHAQHMTIAGSYQDGSTQGNFIELYANGELYVHLVSPTNTHYDTGARVGLHRWYHVALVREGTGSNEMHCYLNGKKTPNSMQENTNYSGARPFRVAALNGDAAYDFDGFISNVRVLKGTALYTSDFTPPTEPLTNITNTVLLTCQSPKHIEHPVAPATPTVGGSPQASAFNPFKGKTKGRPGLYPTMNRLAASDVTNGSIYYGLNLQEGDNYNKWMANFVFGPGAITSGKYYWEITWKGGNGTSPGYAGVTGDFEQDSGEIASQSARNWIGSSSYINYTATSSSSDSRITVHEGQTYGYAIDLDNNKMYFYRDGHLINTDTTIPDADTTHFRPSCISTNDGASGANHCDAHWNWGQRALRYPPPPGYKTLNFANLRSPVSIVRSDQHVGIVTYTGDGANNRQVTGFNFQPDLLWIKGYTATSDWGVYDSVRGVSSRGVLNSDADMGAVPIGSFDHNGYSFATEMYYNASGGGMIAYGWKGGGNKATWNVDGVGYASVSAAGLDGGSINPTGASVNTKAGFSIIRYESTAANPESFEHGLTRKPEFMICKKTGAAGKDGGGGDRGWSTFHHSLADGKVLFMDTADDVWNEPNFWHNNGGVTDSLVYVGGDYNTGDNDGAEYMHYSWHGVPGYSQFGSYNGNGSTDGCFVALSFKPALIFLKMTNADDSWAVITPKLCDLMNAGGGNFIDSHLRTDATGAEYNPGGSPAVQLDLLSNGFKHRQSSGQVNGDGNTYIYCAWAESPLNTLYGGQANAR